jgi:hypothetical protein
MDMKAWSNDEVTLRIRMLETMLNRGGFENDEIMRDQILREVATWEELLSRRGSGIKVVTR